MLFSFTFVSVLVAACQLSFSARFRVKIKWFLKLDGRKVFSNDVGDFGYITVLLNLSFFLSYKKKGRKPLVRYLFRKDVKSWDSMTWFII